MLESKAIQKAIIDLWGQPLDRGSYDYGCSQAGFCLKKLAYTKKLGIEVTTNGDMMIGKIVHEQLRRIIDGTPYGQLHGATKGERYRNRKNAPKYDELAVFEDPRGFRIGGHVDARIPYASRIIELKTTDTKREYHQGEFLTDAYILQANAYACITKSDWWEIWIVYKKFRSISEGDFVTVLEGKANPDLFREYLDRLYLVDQSIKQNKELIGPEQDWECKHCSFFFTCTNWLELIPKFIALLPNEKKFFTDGGFEKIFNIYYDNDWIRYDRTEKKYFLIPDALPKIKIGGEQDGQKTQ